MINKYFILMFFLNFVYTQKCNHNICGGYKIGTFCNYLWITSYVDCMSYLNNNDKKLNDYLIEHELQIRYNYTIVDDILDGFIKCNNKTYDGKNIKTIKYDTNYNRFFNISEFINKQKKLIVKNENITCDFKIYQL